MARGGVSGALRGGGVVGVVGWVGGGGGYSTPLWKLIPSTNTNMSSRILPANFSRLVAGLHGADDRRQSAALLTID